MKFAEHFKNQGKLLIFVLSKSDRMDTEHLVREYKDWEELRNERPLTWHSLISFWKEESRCSLKTAIDYLKADIGSRFKVEEFAGNFTFTDTESGLSYSLTKQGWV